VLSADLARASDAFGSIEAIEVTPLRVLVVDDDPNISRLLGIRLKNRGHVVHTAASGDEAMSRLDELEPDLILLDVSMPGSSGLDVLEHIRSEARDIAVIMMTAFGSEGVAIDALRRGADDYLRKPFEPDEFRAILDRTISQLRLRRHNVELRRRLDEKRRQLEEELARAGVVQASLLPDSLPTLPGFSLAAACLAAREVGGDFYDWQRLGDDCLGLTIGDVMGKGMPAALLMATVRAALRSVAFVPSPGERVRAIEHGLGADLERTDAFVTLFHAQTDLRTGQLTYVDAGHGLGFVRRANGTVDELEVKGIPVGVIPGSAFVEGSDTLFPGDTLVLYSDGLPDSRPDLPFDTQAIASHIRDGDRPDTIVRRLISLTDTGSERPDDVTIIVLQRVGVDHS